MAKSELKMNSTISLIIEFIVIGIIFFLFCVNLSVHSEGSIYFQTLVFSGIALISVRLGNRLLSFGFNSINSVIKIMLSNAMGLTIGACIMLILGMVIPGLGQIAAIVVFSSVMAFFALGTISSLLNIDHQSSTQIHPKS